MKKIFLALFCSFFIIGCGQHISNINIPEINQSESVLLKDLRPESEDSDKIFSYLITSEAYGINRVKTNFVPSMTRLLQHRVYEKLGSTHSHPEIIVHHMVVYSNVQANTRRSLFAASFGGLAGLIAAGPDNNYVALHSTTIDPGFFEVTAKDEYKRGWYSNKENPNNANVIITYIDAEISGKRISVKTISPTVLPKNQENQDIFINAVESAIHYYLEQYSIE